MDKFFNEDYVTLIRRKGDNYVWEQVPQTALAQLHKDPTVLVVFEDLNGLRKGSFSYGIFYFTLTLQEGETASARMQIWLNSDVAYDNTYRENLTDEYSAEAMMEDFMSELNSIFRSIDNELYDEFVDSDCLSVIAPAPEGEVEVESMMEVADLLQENGYLVERLHTVYGDYPCLFTYENELLMFGQRHFHDTFFLEIKRVYPFADPEMVKEAATRALSDFKDLACIQHKDGSWGFRAYVYEPVWQSNLIDLLEMAIAKIRIVIEKVEANKNIYEAILDTTSTYRPLFIYEVIDASLTLSKLNI